MVVERNVGNHNDQDLYCFRGTGHWQCCTFCSWHVPLVRSSKHTAPQCPASARACDCRSNHFGEYSTGSASSLAAKMKSAWESPPMACVVSSILHTKLCYGEECETVRHDGIREQPGALGACCWRSLNNVHEWLLDVISDQEIMHMLQKDDILRPCLPDVPVISEVQIRMVALLICNLCHFSKELHRCMNSRAWSQSTGSISDARYFNCGVHDPSSHIIGLYPK